MQKFYTFLMAIAISFSLSAQSTIDISAINTDFTTTFDGDLVIDVQACTSAVATPSVSFTNPFKGLSFMDAEISFDVYNRWPTVDSIRTLGSLLGIFDPMLGRMYFSNGSYLGFNNGSFVDANMVNFGLGTHFLGNESWKNVQIQFSGDGYAVYVDGSLAYDQNSTDVTINGNLMDYNEIITFLQNAETLVFGTGSFWSDNTKPDGTYWDQQWSYMKNITFTPDFSTVSIDGPDFDFNSEVIREMYYSMDGKAVGADLSQLVPGFYVKKEFFRNGATRSSKFVKAPY